VGPSGTVTFSDGGTPIGSPVSVVSAGASATAFASGTAALPWTFSSTGSHNITAVYSGDTNYATSSATAITITVTPSGSFTISGTARDCYGRGQWHIDNHLDANWRVHKQRQRHLPGRPDYPPVVNLPRRIRWP